MMVVPGVTVAGKRCSKPIDTLCLYPTLIELCQLAPVNGLDGISIVPLLRNPSMEWVVPAVTEFRRGQCAVRSQRYRYIRYSDGTSELYDHSLDSGERFNLSGKEYQDVINSLARFIPESFAPDAPSKSAYDFDPNSYAWINRKTGKITRGKNNK